MSNVVRWTLVGDIGGWGRYHVGDEAMLGANLKLLMAIAPTAAFCVVSADPAFSAAEYQVEAVPRIGFDQCTNDGEREALLMHLSDPRLSDSEQPVALRNLASASDGLVISGGGNLASAWPNCIYERLAFCRRAARSGAPIVILGQTLGPALTSPRHRALVCEILGAAWWVGVREQHSFALALELGVPIDRISYQIDDASACGSTSSAPRAAWAGHDPWIGVTIHPIVNPNGDHALLDQLAHQLSQLADSAQCRLAFIPHARAAADVGAPWSDAQMGQALARRMPVGAMHVTPVLHARHVARLSSQAHMIVSSRAHPLVFALAAGAPALAIWSDNGSRIKLRGALSHYGRSKDACSLDDVRRGLMAARAIALWNDRDAARQVITLQGQVNDVEERLRRRQLATLVATGRPVEITQPRRLVEALATALRERSSALAGCDPDAADTTQAQGDGRVTQAEPPSIVDSSCAHSLEQCVQTLRARRANASTYAHNLARLRPSVQPYDILQPVPEGPAASGQEASC